MGRLIASFVAGLVFAAGLGLSGMTDAGVVVGFLDVLGGWQPALLFVMVGGIAVRALTWWTATQPDVPWFGGRYVSPISATIDGRLLLGAALFGLGWGLGGYCPGPAVVSLATGSAEAWVFGGSMLAGMALQGAWDRSAAEVGEGGLPVWDRKGADCG